MKIYSNLDGITIFQNGEFVEVLHIPENKKYSEGRYRVNFNRESRVEFVVSKTGYWSDTLVVTANSSREDFIYCPIMRREVTPPESAWAFRIDVSKVAFDIPQDQEIAEVYRLGVAGSAMQTLEEWKKLERMFVLASDWVNEDMDRMGFYSTRAEEGEEEYDRANFFTTTADDEEEEEKEAINYPKAVIGARIVNLDAIVQLDGRKFINMLTRSMKIEWMIFNPVTEQIVASTITDGNSYEVIGARITDIEDAMRLPFLDSWRQALNDEAFREALFVQGNEAEIDEESNVSDSEFEPLRLRVSTAHAATLAEASASVVTVIIPGEGHGSGVLVTENGHLLTAAHVVEGADEIVVRFNNGVELPAEILRMDEANDAALIKVAGNGYTPLPIAAATVNNGEDVWAIGTPISLELGQSISSGIISGQRKLDDQTILQTDATVSPGSSGGPLINRDFEIVGIVSNKISGHGAEGIGFARSIADILKALAVAIE